jgi:hypothetical protein
MNSYILRSFLTVQILATIEILIISTLLHKNDDASIIEGPYSYAAMFIVSFGVINVLGNTVLVDIVPDATTRNVMIGVSLGLISAFIKDKVSIPYLVYRMENPKLIYPISIVLYIVIYTQFTDYIDNKLCS